MKAEAAQQRSLSDLVELDAEIGRLEHRAKNLAEQKALDEIVARHREAGDGVAALALALEDLDGEVAKFETEIDSVRQREDRDRTMMDSGTLNSKQLGDMQHELETLERRQASLEDDQLAVMERREAVQNDRDARQQSLDALQIELNTAQVARDDALVSIDSARQVSAQRRTEIAGHVGAELIAVYERQRAGGGAGAGLLQGRRCGACRIEIDRADMSRITAAAADDVVRCPECGAILLRQGDSFK
jgi:uncharacterized protein